METLKYNATKIFDMPPDIPSYVLDTLFFQYIKFASASLYLFTALHKKDVDLFLMLSSVKPKEMISFFSPIIKFGILEIA